MVGVELVVVLNQIKEGCSTKSLGGHYYPKNSSDLAHLLGITQAILPIQRVRVDRFFFFYFFLF